MLVSRTKGHRVYELMFLKSLPRCVSRSADCCGVPTRRAGKCGRRGAEDPDLAALGSLAISVTLPSMMGWPPSLQAARLSGPTQSRRARRLPTTSANCTREQRSPNALLSRELGMSLIFFCANSRTFAPRSCGGFVSQEIRRKRRFRRQRSGPNAFSGKSIEGGSFRRLTQTSSRSR